MTKVIIAVSDITNLQITPIPENSMLGVDTAARFMIASMDREGLQGEICCSAILTKDSEGYRVRDIMSEYGHDISQVKGQILVKLSIALQNLK